MRERDLVSERAFVMDPELPSSEITCDFVLMLTGRKCWCRKGEWFRFWWREQQRWGVWGECWCQLVLCNKTEVLYFRCFWWQICKGTFWFWSERQWWDWHLRAFYHVALSLITESFWVWENVLTPRHKKGLMPQLLQVGHAKMVLAQTPIVLVAVLSSKSTEWIRTCTVSCEMGLKGFWGAIQLPNDSTITCFTLVKKYLQSPTSIRLLLPTWKATTGIHYQVQWLCSRHRFWALAPISSDVKAGLW